MKRLAGIASAMLLSFVLFIPVALAADPFPHTGRVLVSTGGDVTLAEGEQADVVVVVNGTATIRGVANTIVVLDGAADLLGARTETLFAVRSPIELGSGTVVQGDVMRLDSLVHQTGNAQIQGQMTDMATALLIATLIGAPLGLGILFGGLPLVAFVGYLIAGIWLGEWVLRRTSPERVRERPYLAAFVGVLILEALAVVPILAILTMVASLFGFGAVLLLSFRTLRSRTASQPTVAGPMPAPVAG